MPWLGWHDLRRTFTTLGDEMGMSAGERQVLMGHEDARMTAHYTKTPIEQARPGLERMVKKLRGETVNRSEFCPFRAQMEHLVDRKHYTGNQPSKLRVAGSSPAAPTKTFK